MVRSDSVAPTVPFWSWPKRFALAWLVVAITLATLPMPFAAVPYAAYAFRWLNVVWRTIVPLVGKYVFHVNAEFKDLGSGDTIFHYVELVVWAVIAMAVALVWSVFDRDTTRYERVSRLFLLLVRYALALSLVSYGVAKVIPVQFPRPALDILILPYGQSTPYRLAWTFMGASPVFQMFAGWAEVASGFLLTVRRTSLLGSLIGLGVLLNVAAFNFCYGIAAKIQVLHLLALTLIVIAPHSRRLCDFLVMNRVAPPVELRPLFRHSWMDRAAVAARTLAVMAFVLGSLYARHEWRLTYGDLAPRSPLRGIWNVDVFEENGLLRPPLVTDADRWRRVVFDGPLFGTIYDMDDTRHWYRAKFLPGRIDLTTTDNRKTIEISYIRPDAITLVLDATVDGRKIHAVCHRLPEAGFPLTSSRFHWSADFPEY